MIRIFLFCLAFLFYVPAVVFAADEAPHVKITVTPERNFVGPGEVILMAIEQTIDPGWHTYWANPGDSGEAARIDWVLPPGFEAGPIRWPVPEKIVNGPLVTYGFENRAVLLQEIYVADTLSEEKLALTATVNVLVCKEICIPETSTVNIELNTGVAQDNVAVIDAAYNELPTEIDWPAKFGEKDGQFFLDLEIYNVPLVKGARSDGDFALYPYDWGLIDNTALVVVDRSDRRLILKQARGARSLAGMDRLDFVVGWTMADGSQKALKVMAVADESVPAAALPMTENSDSRARTQTDLIVAFSGATALPAALLFALAGGLILNLMPCVFPVLSLKALKLARLSGKEEPEARLQGVFYTAGVLVCFGVLAGLLIVLRTAGQQIGWGFQLQNPVFVLLLAWLMFTIGLNLSGVFEFGGGTLTNVGSKWAAGHSHIAAFFTGALAAIVATPCTAPFMGAAMGYALAQPPAVTMAVFLMLGFGLALPYLLLSFVPAFRRIMPKPGSWMDTFKKILALPMYAAALWLIWVLAQQGGYKAAALAALGAVGLVIAIMMIAAASAGKGRRAGGMVLVALIVAGGVYEMTRLPHVSVMAPHSSSETSLAWTPFTPAVLAEAEKGDDPIFINMTAAWCITCKVNERLALAASATKDLFARHNVHLIEGDWTSRNADITKFLESHGRNGVPLYVYIGPRDLATGQRPDAVVLPQILTPAIIAGVIDPATKQKKD